MNWTVSLFLLFRDSIRRVSPQFGMCTLSQGGTLLDYLSPKVDEELSGKLGFGQGYC